MPTFINIAAYKFATLTNLKSWRERLLADCKTWQLKGTILLSTEGINLFVAGERQSIEALLETLASIPNLGRLEPKFSESELQPFNRMLVRIKKEIIAFGVEGIEPAKRTSPKLPARELKRWLDEGRPLILLDTRNDYEVKLGTFANATAIGVDHFRDFPAAVNRLPADWKERPIVMFCTGGIRCEKAGPYMEREGFQNIFQLDGGILKYFEECGSEHYHGECFVFDQRVGVDPGLHESGSTQCYACLTPLSAEEQRDARFKQGVSCPYCYVTPEEQHKRTLQARQAAIARVTSPLPGSQAYDNYRPLNIPAACDGLSLLQALCTIFPHVSRDDWQAACSQGRLQTNQHEPAVAERIVQGGERYLHLQPATQEPAIATEIRLLHEDEAILVLNKPAPLPMHPSGRFNRNTLRYILNEVYAPQCPRPAHRLDANTTGVVVFARTKHFASLLQPQFTRGDVRKVYLARVQGHPAENAFTCEAPISSTAGELGSREIDAENGLAARTEFRVLERLTDGTALLEIRPLTGRTNQIRVHLWSLGFPICGEQTYLPNQALGQTQTHALEDDALCLHAWQITFRHPLTKALVTFAADPPAWSKRS
jgi:RluA family pseudouridine synthase